MISDQMQLRGNKYTLKYASARDLPTLHAFYMRFFHDLTPPLDLMRLWIRRAPEALVMVFRRSIEEHRKGRGSLVGSFKMLPLRSTAASEIEASRLTGSNLGAGYIAGA